eukprot:TRINITY_DN8347_c0_g1_i1.p1 TRINITY_DN8347_c0_g1~~TRINITY_DN8347_c0_g1_i1.p1  ORF type:complete len:255 (-),score=52.32 TRINITY_DN8347_c0_g1_i1:54-818(-)
MREKKVSPIPIHLNVYDLHPHNAYGYPLGLGAFHTGIEIAGTEYSFGGHDYSRTGVFEIHPKTAYGAKFRETILLGEVTIPMEEILRRISDLSEEFPGNKYHPLNRNCNTFSNELSLSLLNKPIPSYINRLPHLGNIFSCFIPTSGLQALGIAPPSENLQEAHITPGTSNGDLAAKNTVSVMRSNQHFVAFSGSGNTLSGASSSSTSSSSKSSSSTSSSKALSSTSPSASSDVDDLRTRAAAAAYKRASSSSST